MHQNFWEWNYTLDVAPLLKILQILEDASPKYINTFCKLSSLSISIRFYLLLLIVIWYTENDLTLESQFMLIKNRTY